MATIAILWLRTRSAWSAVSPRGDKVGRTGKAVSGTPVEGHGIVRVDDLIQHVKDEHARWIENIGPEDPYVGKYTIGIHEVLQAHFLLAEFFAQIGEGIGGLGPKDINLLHSALSRQSVEFGGKVRWKDRIDVCATLMLEPVPEFCTRR